MGEGGGGGTFKGAMGSDVERCRDANKVMRSSEPGRKKKGEENRGRAVGEETARGGKVYGV